MINRLLGLTLVILSFATIASAQDKLDIQFQPTQVSISEGSSKKAMNGFQYKARPMELTAIGQVVEGLQLRGHIAIPTAFNQVLYNAYDSKGKKTQSTEQSSADVRYRDFGIGIQWEPSKRIQGLYAILDYELTNYTNEVDYQSTGVIVNNSVVTLTNKVNYGYTLLSFGVGEQQQFKKFAVRTEVTIAPILSDVRYQATYSDSTGFVQHNHSVNPGHGLRLSLSGSYLIKKHFGLEGSVGRRSFSYQNSFDKLNDIHPQTRWNTYSIGVVTRF